MTDFKISVNGQDWFVPGPEITYEDIVHLAGYREGSMPSMTVFSKKTNSGKIMHLGHKVQVENELIFDAMFTGNA